MNNETPKHGNSNSEEHESYEHQDLRPAGILYFLLTLVVVTVLCMFGLKGLYAFLDHRERASESVVNPLVKNVPEDTRHIPPGYPQTAFPSPRLEVDERGQLNGIRLEQDEALYSYGWVDEKAGMVHIPIERAMDLLAQRGLPVRPQGEANEMATAQAETKEAKPLAKKGEKK
ncbi:MAG TPA: hypothetical protein VFF50_12885 [Candidatus Deferrimicrobiaceae bacterium]|jgi:hypothetical protein|nr:hypothetical protein [Candidatus Deferrimicrobiaceae bacterium]